MVRPAVRETVEQGETVGNGALATVCWYDGEPVGDGVHEDFNANDRLDSGDVVVFFNNYDDPAVTENAEAYDFNDSRDVDFDDIVQLFGQL